MDGLSKYACLVDFMGYADKDCEKDKIFVKIVKQKHQQYLNGFNQKQNRREHEVYKQCKIWRAC